MLADQIFALIVLIAATLLPEEMLSFVVIPEVQLILGTLVVLYIVLRDPVAGLLLGVGLLIAYFRVFSKKFGFSLKQLFNRGGNTYPMSSLVTDYITPQHLKDAQNNVVDTDNFSKELKGIQGVYGEDVYGAQGLDQKMPGYGEIPLGEEIRKNDM